MQGKETTKSKYGCAKLSQNKQWKAQEGKTDTKLFLDNNCGLPYKKRGTYRYIVRAYITIQGKYLVKTGLLCNTLWYLYVSDTTTAVFYFF